MAWQDSNQKPRQAELTSSRHATQKVNSHCFEKCVPKPGASLSSGESSCFTLCMDKYMAAWNTVSNTYITRLRRENPSS